LSNLLLSGPPRVGKTTLVQKIIEKLPEKAAIAGFFTEEIKEGGVRQGFKVTTLNGREEVFAHQSFPGPNRVGKYGVSINTFEKTAVAHLEEALRCQAQILVVDEIGKMELMSEKFKDVLLRALDSSQLVVATVGVQQDAFTREVRRRADTKTFEVTKENRDELPETILKVLHSRLAGE
jgi:nucleoside-triphosphatase